MVAASWRNLLRAVGKFGKVVYLHSKPLRSAGPEMFADGLKGTVTNEVDEMVRPSAEASTLQDASMYSNSPQKPEQMFRGMQRGRRCRPTVCPHVAKAGSTVLSSCLSGLIGWSRRRPDTVEECLQVEVGVKGAENATSELEDHARSSILLSRVSCVQVVDHYRSRSYGAFCSSWTV